MRRLAWLCAAAASSIVAAGPDPARGDWIVYLGAGIQETSGPLEVRGRQVLFHSTTGTWLSVPAPDVDVPASTFLSWQVAVRRTGRLSPKSTVARPAAAAEAPCVPAAAVGIRLAETLAIRAAAGAPVETVHLACVDAPDTRHKFPELSWFGQEAARTAAQLLPAGQAVCVTDGAQIRRDAEGHRFVFVRLADGRDLGEEILRAGVALEQEAGCPRLERYRRAVADARAAGRGHWGEGTSDVAIAAVLNHLPRAAGPPPARAAGGAAPT